MITVSLLCCTENPSSDNSNMQIADNSLQFFVAPVAFVFYHIYNVVSSHQIEQSLGADGLSDNPHLIPSFLQIYSM